MDRRQQAGAPSTNAAHQQYPPMQALGTAADAPVLVPTSGLPPVVRTKRKTTSGGGAEAPTAEVVLNMGSGPWPPHLIAAEASSPKLYGSPKAGTTPHNRYASAQQRAPGRKQRITYGNRQPLRKEASWYAILVLLAYLASTGYYLYVRIHFTLDMKDKAYSIFILVVECLGITSVIPYAALNAVHTHPTGSAGLPEDDGASEPDKRFHVRVMVPCYKEDIAVIQATVTAAMEAKLPPGVTRTLYLCDDGKDPHKKAWLEATFPQGTVVYVSDRKREQGEINGKSANLNNCLKNIIYPQYVTRPGDIPVEEVLVVFDADMQATPQFFCKILEVMLDDEIALCLSPQAFTNVNTATDIFNNSNQQFWEYILPGCDAMGYIACTGTNFCMRARALGTVGWFPQYCITEDYALSMELRAAGFKGRYLAEYLAVGEAPDELRNLLRQRSRWTKGHMQVFFSMRNPLIRWRLPFHLKLLYNNGTWSYFCTVLATWTFLLVPFLSLEFELQPVKFGREFALAATLYLATNQLVQNYFHVAEHARGIWFAQISNYLLSWTYAKAIFNVLLAKVHLKQKAGFKATEKTVAPAGATPIAPLPQRMLTTINSLTRRMSSMPMDLPMGAPKLVPAKKADTPIKHHEADETVTDKVVMFLCLTLCLNTIGLAVHQAFVAGKVTAWLALPALWAIYNAVPPVLFFSYVLFSTSTLQVLCFMLQLVSSLAGITAIVCLWFIPADPIRL